MADARRPQPIESPVRNEQLCIDAADDLTFNCRSAPTVNPDSPAAAGVVIESNGSSSLAAESVSESAMAGKPKARKNSSPVKAVRYEDAENAAPPVVVSKILKPSEGLMRSNARDGSVDVASSTGSTRSGSGSGNGNSKIAGLRAAFEKGAPQENRDSTSSLASVKRRWTAHDKVIGANGKSPSELDKERELRQALEERCALFEEEMDKLRHVYEEKCAFLVGEAEQRESTFVDKYATVDRHAQEQRSRLSGLAEEAQEQRDALEEKYAALEEEVAYLRVKGLSGNDVDALEPDGDEDEVDDSDDLVRARSRADDEVRDLQRQLAEMKRNISMSTRMDGQVTDSVFAQETEILHHELQNWVVNNFRRAKADVAPHEMCSRLEGLGLTPGQRHQLRPMYAGFAPTEKLVMYQATAVCLLMDIFNDESLFGLPENLEWREPLTRASKGLESTLSPTAHNKWRAVTLDTIRQSEGMQELVSPTARSIAERICSVLTVLAEVEGNGARLAALTGIVRRAIDLQHLFRAQRARYQFDLPSTSDVYHPAVMDNIAVDESPIDLSSRIVKAATWPSLIKLGDEFGDNVHFTNVIVKAKVVCT